MYLCFEWLADLKYTQHRLLYYISTPILDIHLQEPSSNMYITYCSVGYFSDAFFYNLKTVNSKGLVFCETVLVKLNWSSVDAVLFANHVFKALKLLTHPKVWKNRTQKPTVARKSEKNNCSITSEYA